MKANAPEKLYIDLFKGEFNISRSPTSNSVEYIRTDAFIERATLWLMENASDYCTLHNSYDTKELVKDFVNAMKRD